jgi:uncharacterized coiled-coil protein SlyX
MPQKEDLRRRVTELETMYMHLQQDYEALNETVLMHVTLLERMSNQLNDIDSKLPSQMGGGERRSPEEEKPPHY